LKWHCTHTHTGKEVKKITHLVKPWTQLLEVALHTHTRKEVKKIAHLVKPWTCQAERYRVLPSLQPQKVLKEERQ
jgi:hypothetical protein